MTWTITSGVEEYAAAAEPWLLRDPVRNTVVLTVLRGIRTGQFAEDLLMGWLTDEEGGVAGAFCHTPPRPLLLGDVPPGALPALAAALIERDREIAGVTGPVVAAETFAGAWWRPATGRTSQRLYRLGALRPPSARGKARIAGQDDLALAVRFFREFQEEAHVDRGADPTPVVAVRLNRDELLWWEDDDRPVSIAGVSAPIAGMSRIGPVYTPPGLRGRGYGSAVTHAATRKALDEGATEVLLFTDLGNPTSNSIYQRLGYRPVADYVTVHFE
ncbi:GNAT family N-acetyltransferase [Microbispora triticiradicis]|uniref:GNAT family N-acetyltransferase n=1 Tax=Microbispora triticiradicis TaxID=2200763 RepID=A0ABX9LKX3_9ACTN|nr:GNAT family N-acetyltransferase [Microbispora triticiradicis]RGA03764.1 GNAT family N-acetyltransferase [Microbispora triticiradicis]